MTLQEEFDNLVSLVYPGGLLSTSPQYLDMQRMFFAGCHVGYNSDIDHRNEIEIFVCKLEAPPQVH